MQGAVVDFHALHVVCRVSCNLLCVEWLQDVLLINRELVIKLRHVLASRVASA